MMVHEQADNPLPGCPFCDSACIEVLAVEIDMYAAVCRACGAHGPVRVLGPKQLVEFVKEQAAADWRRRFEVRKRVFDVSFTPEQLSVEEFEKLSAFYRKSSTESDKPIGVGNEIPEGPAVASPVEGQARDTEPGEAVSTAAPGNLKTPSEGASVEQSSNKAAGEPREEDRKPDNGGEAVTHSLATPGPSTAPAAICTRQPADPQGQQSEAPNGGGALSEYQLNTGDRLAKLLGDIGMSADTAVKKGMDFGVSRATLYHILNGRPVSQKTLKAMNIALYKIERGRKLSGAASAKPSSKAPERLGEYDEGQVQALPNKFKDPAAGVNRAPAPTAPPRHARTP